MKSRALTANLLLLQIQFLLQIQEWYSKRCSDSRKHRQILLYINSIFQTLHLLYQVCQAEDRIDDID